MEPRYGLLENGLMGEIKRPRLSAAKQEAMKAAFLAAITIDDGGHWRFDARPEAERPGQALIEGQLVNPSRYAWVIFNGDVPPGHSVRAKCGGSHTENPCLNPEHRYLLGPGEKHYYCNAGHRFTEETTAVNDKGYRRCLICRPPKEKAA